MVNVAPVYGKMPLRVFALVYAYHKLYTDRPPTHRAVAEFIGTSQPSVTNAARQMEPYGYFIYNSGGRPYTVHWIQLTPFGEAALKGALDGSVEVLIPPTSKMPPDHFISSLPPGVVLRQSYTDEYKDMLRNVRIVSSGA